VSDYGRVIEWNECLIRAIAEFDLGQFTYSPYEFIAAGRGVTTLPSLGAHKSRRENVLAPAKQGAEEPNLFGRRPGCWYFSRLWQLYVDFRLNVERGKLGSEGGQTMA
jgi:hypothetical protein